MWTFLQAEVGQRHKRDPLLTCEPSTEGKVQRHLIVYELHLPDKSVGIILIVLITSKVFLRDQLLCIRDIDWQEIATLTICRFKIHLFICPFNEVQAVVSCMLKSFLSVIHVVIEALVRLIHCLRHTLRHRDLPWYIQIEVCSFMYKH